jgi:hypothetical protein
MKVARSILSFIISISLEQFVAIISVTLRRAEVLVILKKIENVRFEVFTAVTMKNGIFWDVMPCGSCKNPRFGGI